MDLFLVHPSAGFINTIVGEAAPYIQETYRPTLNHHENPTRYNYR
jgi:hypothetical protein